MASMMFGPVLLVAALVSPEIRPSAPAPAAIATFRPSGGATARATASVRIVSGVRFGPGKSALAPGAHRRTIHLADQGGVVHPLELLEFQ
jgi:hypothetical protein